MKYTSENGSLFVTSIFLAFLILEVSSKPVNEKSSQPDHARPPNLCHLDDTEPVSYNVTTDRLIMTKIQFLELAVRFQELHDQIENIKEKIAKNYNTAVIKKCLTSNPLHNNNSLPCRNSSLLTNQESTRCLVSTYNILTPFSSSMKFLNDKNFASKENIREVLKSVASLEKFIDQVFCQLDIDLRLLGYNTSTLLPPHLQQPIILSDFIKLTEKKNNKDCYNDAKLNQLQVLHGIYQFLNSFSNVTLGMTKIFSSKYIQDSPTINSMQTNSTNRTTAESPTTETSLMTDLRKLIVG